MKKRSKNFRYFKKNSDERDYLITNLEMLERQENDFKRIKCCYMEHKIGLATNQDEVI